MGVDSPFKLNSSAIAPLDKGRFFVLDFSPVPFEADLSISTGNF